MHQTLKIKYSFLKILTGWDLSRRRLPIMIADSGRKGPLLWLTACCHGDEVGGIVIIQDVFKKIRKNNSLLKGALYAFPLMNPIGFETQTRNITFSKEDLNRSFPGNPKGSLGERIADIIFSTIVNTSPTLVIDLHNDWIRSIPYALLDPDPGPEHTGMYNKTKMFAQKTGFLVIRDTEELHRSLSYSLQRRHIPSLTLELGESYVINEENIEFGVKSIENIMAYLGMTDDSNDLFQYTLPNGIERKIFKYYAKPYSSTIGIIRFLVKPGQAVKKEQPIAKIYSAFGKLQETMQAMEDGIVLGHTDTSVAFPGKPIMAFGINEW